MAPIGETVDLALTADQLADRLGSIRAGIAEDERYWNMAPEARERLSVAYDAVGHLLARLVTSEAVA